MRPFVLVCAVSLISFTALAQRGGHAGGGGHASVGAARSGGSVSHSGGSSRGGVAARSGVWSHNGYRGGGTYHNGGYRGGYRNGFYGYRRYGYGSLYPFYGFGWGYGYDPFYLGWGGDYSGYYNKYPAANYSYDNGAYQQPQPPVIINQGMPYAEPAPPPPSPELTVREFTPPAPPDPKDRPDYGPVLYLFALKNNSILAAFTYWTEKGELHYVNLDHQTKMVPLNSIDRELTDRLNRERNLSVKIPG